MVTHNPLHRSGRACFPRLALALGEDAKAAQGIIIDAGRREPAVNQPPSSVASNTTVLASPRQRSLPEPAYVEPKHLQRRPVHGHPFIGGSVHSPLRIVATARAAHHTTRIRFLIPAPSDEPP